MLKFSEDALSQYEREMREVRSEIENARRFLGEMKDNNAWTAPEQRQIRGEVGRVRSTLQHYVNRANGIGDGVRNVRNTVQARVRARRDTLNGFTSTGGSSSVFSRANMRTIHRAVITIRFPALSPLINGFIDKLVGK